MVDLRTPTSTKPPPEDPIRGQNAPEHPPWLVVAQGFLRCAASYARK
jgi:hypothetical protein